MTAATKPDLNQVTTSRRRVIDPAWSEISLTSLSDLNRLVRTRMLGGVGFLLPTSLTPCGHAPALG